MEKNSSSSEELKAIRKIMEESTKFLSLSGFSGVFLGLFAIAGAIIALTLIPDNGIIHQDEFFRNLSGTAMESTGWHLVIVALSVLLCSLATAFYFSSRKAKRSGKRFWTPVSKRLLINLFIPLFTGGCFAVILLIRDNAQLIIPVLLIFYGLALVNAGKFTYGEIFYLGLLEIFTGLVSTFFPAQGFIFWIAGFGILHIVYGLFMYRKYEA